MNNSHEKIFRRCAAAIGAENARGYEYERPKSVLLLPNVAPDPRLFEQKPPMPFLHCSLVNVSCKHPEGQQCLIPCSQAPQPDLGMWSG